MTKEEAMKKYDLIERPKGELMIWDADDNERPIENIECHLTDKGARVGALVEYERAINIGNIFVVVTKEPNDECECTEPCHCDECHYEEFDTIEEAKDLTKALGMEGDK